jgi:phosphoribosylaminoimidazole-succinocarboxamide synthase
VRVSLFEPFTEVQLALPDRRDGKVRTSWALDPDIHGARRLIVTTDRLSAFDRVLAGVPYKGQVLNQLAAWWFARTADIVPNHVLTVPDENALVARSAHPLAVEVVVRGHITGVTDTSLWGMYAAGARQMYGYVLPDGLRKNTPLPRHIVTPTTKAESGGHDQPLSCAEVVDRGLLPADLWEHVQAVALALFARGVDVAEAAGLILADTKYEFGLVPGEAGEELLLIDEVHTPDSSRFWMAESYEQRVAAGDEPESLDKEFVRRAFADLGYKGDGPVPILSPDVWSATAGRYVLAYETLTGEAFLPGAYPVQARLTEHLTKAGLL